MPTIEITNHSSLPFTGWYRTKTDDADINSVGQAWRVGRRIGLDTHAIDIYLADLSPGERRKVDLSEQAPADAKAPPAKWPANILEHFGGPLALNGRTMPLIGAAVDGAAVRAHFRTHAGSMLVVDVWSRWYPGQPWVEGEYQITASNPATTAMVATIPELLLTFGRGFPAIVGRQDIRLATRGQTLADAQARSASILFLFPHLITDPKQWSSYGALSAMAVAGHGIARMWHEGTGSVARDFKPLEFATKNADAARRLHTWDHPLLGPSIRSADTGAQEDQLFHVGAEGSGLEIPRYLAALKLHSERPCNYREADGGPLDLELHPGLGIWDGRPDRRFSMDMLGKIEDQTLAQTNGRAGPDSQHFLNQTLFSSIRCKDSPALQQLASNLATVYLCSRTTDPRLSTSATFSAREWLYEPLFAVHCHYNLEDRELATRVVDRCRDRIQQVLLPAMANRQHLYVFQDDNRLGSGKWVIGWQEAAGAYGIDLFGEVFGIQEARDLARRVAMSVMESGWHQDQDGRWLTRAQYPVDGQQLPEPDGSFNDFGMPLAIAVVLKDRPSHPEARAIWDQLLAGGAHRWVVPGLTSD
jgi:hypothetical protein